MGMKLQVVRLPARRGRRRSAAAGDEPRRRRVGRSVGPSGRSPAACGLSVFRFVVRPSVRSCDIMRSLAGAMEFVRRS